MGKKEFVVFGLGHFGKSVALTLADSGCEVMVVDDSEEKIHDIADRVTYAVRADVTDAETLATLGLKNFDGAVVAIGENLEASVLVTIMAKELGIPYVLAKVLTDTQAKVLKKVGADMVVFPEKETGIRIANKLMYGKFFDAITLSRTYSIMEIDAHKDWIGKSLIDLNLRKVHGINVVAIKQKGAIKVNPEPKEVIKEADVLIVLGKSEVLNKLGGTQKQYKDGDKDDNQ